jgi:hypothetical protein
MTDLVPIRPAGTVTAIGGLTIVGLGIIATVRPDSAGPLWFVVAGVAAELLALGLLGLLAAVAGIRVARVATAVSAVAMALFGLAHFYALVDEDTAVGLFSAFMVLAAAGLVVAGVAVARTDRWSGARRFVPLLTGVWPVATIPAGAALGDVPHFLAIAVWGACWTALGLVLLGTRTAPQVGLTAS